ncbi:tRNA (guanosine-2'-O-)-methyltransferase [Chitinophaga skermanii]|uniref:tRNA (guanosine(18)-2'-O)-methyltransferase n=1 Tax=Chitinophaga skermanii TaxID=331697 RepID=A0A327QFT5_9BACT|nr:RNA methyltransferase [Chitinophaga skermanii]RAJ02492.1 tRNA (guanosine-2'-O-)-methyltransferase [Chitinophaga skermanii]
MTPERSARLIEALRKRQPDLAVVLDNVFDPHNVAAVLRTADAVGIQEVYTLTNTVPKHKRYGFKSSSSARDWMTVHDFTDPNELVQVLRGKYHRILTTHLSTDAVSMHDIDFTSSSIALVFGNEQYGVSQEILHAADGNFIIPQVGIIKSLNISVACAVTIYEAMRQKEKAGHYANRRLGDEQYYALQAEWGFKPGEIQD